MFLPAFTENECFVSFVLISFSCRLLKTTVFIEFKCPFQTEVIQDYCFLCVFIFVYVCSLANSPFPCFS